MRDLIEKESLEFDIVCGVPYGAIPLSTVKFIFILFQTIIRNVLFLSH